MVKYESDNYSGGCLFFQSPLKHRNKAATAANARCGPKQGMGCHTRSGCFQRNAPIVAFRKTKEDVYELFRGSWQG